MIDYSSLEVSDLYDLLAIYTVQYTKMISAGATHRREFERTKEMIESFQLEIEKRLAKENSEHAGYIDGYMPAIS
jgi:hypothetical protein